MSKPVHWTGRRFHVLTVLRRDESRPKYWICRCDCGVEKSISHSNLIGGNTRSCGCLMLELRASGITKHGHASRRKQSRTYQTWLSMVRRCNDSRDRAFSEYGARGITVCQRWKSSFENFLADMGERPAGTSIDRYPNSNGNYEPGNCKWSTPSEQAVNRRSTRFLTINGETLCVTDWAKRSGQSSSQLFSRLRRGWSPEEAICA